MARSEFFNKQYPLPTDVDVYPLYKEYVDLQKTVTKNWVDEAVAGHLSLRNLIDFDDCRLSVKTFKRRDAVVTISLKPFIGIETHDDLEYYQTFLSFYKNISDKILNLMMYKISYAQSIGIEADTKKAWLTNWHNTYHYQVHFYICFLEIIVRAANLRTLRTVHLELLDGVSYTRKGIDKINSFVRILDIGMHWEENVKNGDDFFNHPNGLRVGSFWRYAHTAYKRLLEEVSEDD